MVCKQLRVVVYVFLGFVACFATSAEANNLNNQAIRGLRPIGEPSMVDQFPARAEPQRQGNLTRTAYQWSGANDGQPMPRPQLNSGQEIVPDQRNYGRSVMQVQGMSVPGGGSLVTPAAPSIYQNPVVQNPPNYNSGNVMNNAVSPATPVMPPGSQPLGVQPSQLQPSPAGDLAWVGPNVATVDNSRCVTPPVQYAFSDACGCDSYIQPTAYAQVQPPATFVPPPAVIAPQVVMPGAAVPAYYTENAGFRPLVSLGQENYNVQLGRGIIGQPTAYVPGQSIRNFFRYIFP